MIPDKVSTYDFSVSIRSTKGLAFLGLASTADSDWGLEEWDVEAKEGDSGGELISGIDNVSRKGEGGAERAADAE